MISRRTLLVPLALSLGACTSGGGGSEDVGDVSGAVGAYQVTSSYDATGALPEVVGDSLETLTGLHDDPAGTMITLLEDANVPIVEEVLDAIPDFARDQFAGWINDYIASRVYMGVPVTEEIARWSGDLSGILTRFDVITDLDLARLDASGETDANHMISAVAFELRGDRRVIDTPAIVEQLTVARTVPVAITSDDAGGGTIEIGEHAFHMPLGDLALVGFNQALGAVFGAADLTALLGGMLDCPGLAASIADRCVGPVCVGHEGQIEELCLAGVDLVVAEVERRVTSVEFAEIHHAAGSGVLLGEAKQDGTATVFDTIEDGAWDATVNIDGVSVPVGATFVGVRK
jgi:hypothetical protein